MPKPTVRTMRQPPERIPRVIAEAHVRITHKGTTNSLIRPESTRTRVMMPMDF